MGYEIGKVYTFGEQERKVIAFDGAGYPVTTMDLEAKPINANGIDLTKLRQELETDLRGKWEQERLALISLLPMDKCTMEQLEAIAKHMGIHTENAGSKAELLAIVTGVKPLYSLA